MPGEIKLTQQDLDDLERRLRDPALPSEEMALIKALLEMAKKHRLEGEEGEPVWIFLWRPTPPTR